ncbi:MAG: Eco57I restriction-modification methylase domain-containing protein [Melioribacteraceae bacterium]|nr:Eco57I restriction-modification methylase domain-containing protein [Melioribacteraceae bacterium]
MFDTNSIQPTHYELPSFFADRLGEIYTASVTQQHKKENGQFFTPVEIALFMASLSEFNGNFVRILDPGSGTSILSCALIEKIINNNKYLKYIELVIYETDTELIPILKKSLKYLKNWVENKNVEIVITFYSSDFVLHNSDALKETPDLFTKQINLFDVVISNPPYFKLSIEDERAIAAKIVVNGHPNIYSIFMALSAKLLKEDGELIFITPRSYASGSYFRAFREYFFNIIDLDKAHLFVSRKEAFNRDKVLQEVVIIKGTKRNIAEPFVEVSSSSGLNDLATPKIKIFPKNDIVNVESKEKVLYLPTSNEEEVILNIFQSWSGNLNKYDIKISTGPVVSFRSWDKIIENYEDGAKQTAPLFWLHNVKQMILEWPIENKKKGQYIIIDRKSETILIPNKNYIFLRRFSSKDDKNRLIAAPYFSNFIRSDFIGVENKLNYIYRQNGYLERNEIVGLCTLLNSTLFDAFFRIFNGNVNVSATELRDMPLPPLEIIHEIGNTIILSNNYSVENVNLIVNKYFEPVKNYEEN